MSTGLETKQQHNVTVVNNDQLFQAFALRSTKRNEAILRERVATGTDTSPVTIEIDGKRVHGFLAGISYPDDVTATCKLRAKGYDDITLVLNTNGWTGVATSTVSN